MDSINRIARARELLITVRHAAMATVNEDGSPHNTPYLFLCSADRRYLYWGSHPQSQHSINLARTGKLFVVLYDAIERGGLFIRAHKAHVAEGRELEEALAEHNRRRGLYGWAELPLGYYEGNSPQRMYVALTQQFWVNDTERDEHNRLLRDIRRGIAREALTEESF